MYYLICVVLHQTDSNDKIAIVSVAVVVVVVIDVVVVAAAAIFFFRVRHCIELQCVLQLECVGVLFNLPSLGPCITT